MEQGNQAAITQALNAIAIAIQNQNILMGNVPVKFKVWTSGGGTLTASADTKILFDTEDYDTGNNFDIANDRFVAPYAGWYQFDCAVHVSASASGHNVQLRKNGSIVWIGQELQNLSGTSGLAGTCTLFLQAGDYIELYAYNGSGGAKTYLGTAFRTYLSGMIKAVQ